MSQPLVKVSPADLKARKAQRTPTPKSGNRSDFIRSQPIDLPVAALIEAGKKQGLEIQAGLVYMVRGRMNGPVAKKGPGRPRKVVSAATTPALPKKAQSAAPPVAIATAAHRLSPSAIERLASVVLEIGVDPAIQILEDFKRRLEGL